MNATDLNATRQETGPAVLTVDEAHAIVGRDKISRASWYGAINRGEVPSRRIGKRILIPRHAFMRWLESAGQQATAVR